MAYIIDFELFIPKTIDYEYLNKIEGKIRNKQFLTNEEYVIFLDNINYLVRKKISLDMIEFRNTCDLAQSILYHYFKSLGCNVIPSTTHSAITSNIVGHNFLVVEFNVEQSQVLTLIDPTYIQFFKEEDCNTDKFYLSKTNPQKILITPNPGFFIEKSQGEAAKYLLEHGHIILTEDVARMYGDSFYNTKVGVPVEGWKVTSIPGKVYINAFTKPSGIISKTLEELEKNSLDLNRVIKNHNKGLK